ncbi:hypothetical protein ElyMa_002037800 [Elysia marginata]|uniref:Uncharacterized protein n=1 Tax=Elysia marginata TaxID=1093978 RepID=A0AAV4F8D3_9GAST|nr:hypothetical protein ElyMa_002037800 [Elysia marginata]
MRREFLAGQVYQLATRAPFASRALRDEGLILRAIQSHAKIRSNLFFRTPDSGDRGKGHDGQGIPERTTILLKDESSKEIFRPRKEWRTKLIESLCDGVCVCVVGKGLLRQNKSKKR